MFLSKFFIYLSFVLAYLCVAWQIPLLIPFSTINIISESVIKSKFTPVFLKQACHAHPDADTKYTGSSSYLSRHIFLKFSNTYASNNVSL